MKKFRMISTLALSVLLCGSVVLAGCGDDKEPKPTPADTTTKTEVVGSAMGSLETVITGGKAYKVALDVDFVSEEKNEQNVFEKSSANLDGSVYFQYTPGENPVINADAFIDGKATGEDVAKPDLYAAAYLRTDTVTFGYLNQNGITAEQKNGMSYTQMAMEDLMAMLGSMGGAAPFTVEEGVGGEVGGAGGASMIAAILAQPSIQALVTKAANGIIVGADATVVKKGDVTTLTYDVAAEMNGIYNTAKAVVDSIKTETTLGQVLENATVKAFFNKYFSAITAAEVKAAVDVALGAQLPAPEAGESAYDYIVKTVKTMFAEYMSKPVGSAEIKTMLDNALNSVKATIDMFKEFTVSMSVKKDVFYGFGVSLDVQNAENKLDFSFAVTMEETTYNFVDVSKLNVVGA